MRVEQCCCMILRVKILYFDIIGSIFLSQVQINVLERFPHKIQVFDHKWYLKIRLQYIADANESGMYYHDV